MSIRINLGEWGSVFAIPTSIVDRHIKIASPLQLRIILFLLRNSENSYTTEQLSEFFSAHNEDVQDGIRFWVERGVLCENSNEYTPVSATPTQQPEIKSEPQEKLEVKEEKPKVVRRTQTRLTKPDIISSAQRVSEDESLQHLLAEVEAALSKPLSCGDTSTIVMLYDTCGLPAEVIAMLVHYCVSIDKGSMRKIEQMGVEWADAGIDSLESADNRISQMKQTSENWNTVKGVFGLKNAGSATKKQLEYADKWVGEWHFSGDMLRHAYEICVDQTGDLSMPYINKILKRWQSAGVFRIEDIEKLDNNKKPAKKKASASASYDIEDLEKIQ